MKRTATEVLRRSLENTLANWPLLVLRLAESLLLLGLIIMALVALIVPLAVSIGLGDFKHVDPGEIAQMLPQLLLAHLGFIAYILGIVLVVATVFLITHSAIEAGSAAVYLEGERAADVRRSSTMERFDTFTFESWWEGVRGGWWRVFWIYNIAWSAASLVIAAPAVIASLATMALASVALAAAIGVGCLGIIVTLLMAVVVSVITNVCVKKATVMAVAGSLGASEALSASWREVRSDFGRQITVAVILIVIAVGGAGVISMMSAGLSFSHSLSWELITSPVRIVSSLLNAAFGALTSGWFLAAFSSMAAERRIEN